MMLFWIIWIIVTVVVLVSKFYTVKEVSKLNRMLSEEEKHLSAAKVEAKVARSSLEVTRRSLIETHRITAGHEKMLDKLKREVTAIEQEEAFKMQESKEKLSRS